VWDDHPLVALGRLYLEAVGGDSPLDRAQRVQRLVKQNPDHAESHRIAADAALTAKLWGQARRHLERLLELERVEAGADGEPTADTCRRMARLEAGEHGAGSSGERQWLDMAARARGNADWICNTCGTPGAGGPETAGWQLTCPHCDAIDSLVWRAGSAGPRGDGGFLLEPPIEAMPATAFLTASTLPPAPPVAAHAATSVAPPPGPIPHGPIPHGSPVVQPVPNPAAARETAEPAPIGASVDAARRVN
jgi:HemY protein